MNKPDQPPQTTDRLPQSKVRRNWKTHLLWLIPLAALGFVGWLVYTTLLTGGPKITIRFRDGGGLEAGNSDLKYRGAKIGSVDHLSLSEDRQWVVVRARLKKSAAELARTGTEFWIVQPELSMGQVRGLRTIVSGSYIGVKPGTGGRQLQFTGLEEPPLIETDKKGLRLVLLTDKLGSVQKGSPLYYRDVQVGEVLKTQFTPVGDRLQIHVWINEPFVSLVGKNSKFWGAGGLNVQMGLGGINVRAESVKALVQGGIAFATPGGPQGKVQEGEAFLLHPEVLPEWLGFSPTNAAGSRVLIHLKNAEGLLSGQSDVRYLDIKVGEVLQVMLARDKTSVDVIAELGTAAGAFAREGAEFWVVRPEIKAGSVQGLQAIGTGNYIAIKPGHGPPRSEFAGLNEAPVITSDEAGLRVVFISDKLGSVQKGSPIFYRGIKVGEVLGSQLGPEAQVVQIFGRIEPHYAPLVRKDTKFWNAGGVRFDLGLLGANIQAQSLQTLISGGIAFATPEPLDAPAPEGAAFRLYEKPEDKWLSWAPAIKLPGKS